VQHLYTVFYENVFAQKRYD